MTTAEISEERISKRVRKEVERTLLRGVKGLRYIATSDPAVGVTPKETLYERGTLRLDHYHAQTEEVYRVPVLLIMSLVSKPYILDLAPGQSFVEFLVKQGYDVYMIDWGVPREADRGLKLEDYVLDFIPDCIDRILEHSGEDELSLVGYCMGGLLSVLYCALHEESPVRNLGCFTTPIDYDGMELFKKWTAPEHFDVDRIVDTLGNVPPSIMYASFSLLRPVSQIAGRVRLWDNMWNDEFVESYRRFDRWAADQIPFPGECFRQTTKELQQENRLLKGTFQLDGQPVLLENVRQPILHVLAQHDHIVPYDAAKALIPNVGSKEREQMVLKGGHVSLVAGPNAVLRMWPALDEWLSQRSE
ncbi:MAG: alpha/beta fold hydrolase [Acidobacteriota bacterium]